MTPKVLFPAALVCLILLFLGSPETYEIRSLELSWDMGHIVAYCLWTYLFIKYFRPLSRLSYGYQWLWSMGLALIFGAIVEVIQDKWFGRTAALDDVIKNMIGCALSLALFAPKRLSVKRFPRHLLQLLILFLVLGEFLPLAQAVTDELIAGQQFPVLATFETPFEITRWEEGNSKIAIDHHQKSQGKASLRIDLNQKGYSGASLEFFPRDWRNFSTISFMLFNPWKKILPMACRINDFDHNRNGYHRDDRFGQKITLKPGWNRIEIPLEVVKKAPARRNMNMAEIEAFTVFSYMLDRPLHIYLDDVRLNP